MAASGPISDSHTRLLEADDSDYGQLYIAEEDTDLENLSEKHNYYNFGTNFCDSDVPGPAPEVEPPRPAPKEQQRPNFYYDSAAGGQATGLINRDLNDNFNDNHQV